MTVNRSDDSLASSDTADCVQVCLRRQLADREARLRQLERHLALKDRRVRELTALLAVRDTALSAVHCSLSWSLIQSLRRLRYLLAPAGTRRDRLVLMGIRLLRLWREAGLPEVVRRLHRKLRRRWPAVPVPDEATQTAALLAASSMSAEQCARQRQLAEALPYRPLVSILTPVYNPPPHVLRDTLDSVLAQTYGHWELCLADGCSTDPEIQRVLQEYAHRDERIRVALLEQNLGISGNSNAALDMAQGEFVALLDHDDLLAPQMLYEVVRRLNEKPETDLVYFDEDKISADKTAHCDVFLKPAWSPELLLSSNYLMHSVVRRALVTDVGGFDPARDGAQDWDLMLRCAERTDRIEHVPEILYHWRQVPNSCAGYDQAKPYAQRAQQAALAAHLERQGISGVTVTSPFPGIWRCQWRPRGGLVSIIIPTKDKAPVLRRCVTSILERTTNCSYEILLIDNDSKEPATRALYEGLLLDARVRLIDYRAPFNYSTANNLGAAHARGEFLLFLNNDTEILDAGWLEELVRWAERPAIGAVGAKLLYPNGTIQHAGVIMGLGGYSAHLFAGVDRDHAGLFGSVNWYRNYLAVTGACVLMRRDVFDEIGGFDEQYELAYSDVEICLRIVEYGYRIVYTPFCVLRHDEGQTRADYIPAGDYSRAFERMAALVEAGDPYFHPLLSYASAIPAVRLPHEEPRLKRLQRILQQFGKPPALPQSRAA